jgi:hypothetical protein
VILSEVNSAQVSGSNFMVIPLVKLFGVLRKCRVDYSSARILQTE